MTYNLQNDSTLLPRLVRGLVGGETLAVAALVQATYPMGGSTPLSRSDQVPSGSGPVGPLNWGTSVTLRGTIAAEKGDRYRRIRLSIGDRTTSAVVFGRRVWQRRGSDLVPSPPQALEPTEIASSLAFGGQYRVQAGLELGLPHPGFTARYELNPEGVGFYRTAEEAEQNELAPLELEDQLVRAWTDRPEPVLFAPCPAHVAARMPTQKEIEMDPFRAPLLLSHPAPRRHIVESLGGDDLVRVDGMSTTPLVIVAPPSPLVVWVMRRGRQEFIEGSLRTLHMDVDARTYTCLFGHSFACPVDSAPRAVCCEDARTQ